MTPGSRKHDEPAKALKPARAPGPAKAKPRPIGDNPGASHNLVRRHRKRSSASKP